MRKQAYRTDPGKKRSQNEDALLALPESGIYVVADGVGGRACGEVASALCVESFREGAKRVEAALAAYAESRGLETRNGVLAALDEVLQTASRRIYETAEAEGREGMTTTVVACVFGGGTAFLAHVGDSRGYLARDGQLIQLTDDHSMINELVRTGKMTYAEAKTSRHRNVITRAVGLFPSVQPSLGSMDVLPGDRFLLCSDGLSDVVPSSVLCKEANALSLDGAADVLLKAALDGGGPDNITFVLIDPAGADRGGVMATRAAMLESLVLFEDMPYAARLQVGRVIQEHHFLSGETLVEQGVAGSSIFFVMDGEVVVRAGTVELARLGTGEHFGELALADDLPRSASVVGLSAGSAISISAQQLREFCYCEPELGNELLWRLMRVLGRRLRETNTRVHTTPAT